MATFRGISAVGTAVLGLFADAWTRAPFQATTLDTKLVRSDDLSTRPVEFGLTAYVFRVSVNGTQRTLPPAVQAHRRPLPVEVDFLVTAWATSAQRELELLGWAMRVLDDEPVLPPAALNRAVPGVFAPDETVEVVPAQLPMDEYFRLWDSLTFDYQVSMAYAARVVRIESDLTLVEAGPVLERELQFAQPTAPIGAP